MTAFFHGGDMVAVVSGPYIGSWGYVDGVNGDAIRLRRGDIDHYINVRSRDLAHIKLAKY